MMKQLALQQDDVKFSGNTFNIVSVGRIDPVKRFSSIPQIVNEILFKGKSVCWYIIGPKGGNQKEYELLLSNIEKYKVQKNVILLGERNNPYYFIKNAELLVSTSISEACPYVINESKVLGTPIISTNFGSAHEFVSEGYDGYCVPIEHIADTVCRFIENKEDYSRVKLNLSGVYSSEFDISLVSSFVPENEIIKEFNRVTIKKDYVNLFSFLQSSAVIITGSSEKNMSLEFISMPIFK